jgi:hypothetical protein
MSAFPALWISKCLPLRLLLDSSQSLSETVNTSAHIDKLLLAGVERMALGANVHTQLTALCGAGDKSLTAGAANRTLNVFGMNSVLHFTIPHFEIPDVL